MGEDARFRAVAALAQALAAIHTSSRADAAGGPLREAARAAAAGAMSALDGSFAAVSVWERERGRLRVLANVGELTGGETEFPEDESYPVPDYPEIAGVPYAGASGAAAYGAAAVGEAGRMPGGQGALAGAPGRAAGPGQELRAWVETREGPPGWSLPEARPDSGAGAGVPCAGPGPSPRAAALRRRGRGCCVVAPIVLHGRAWGELYVARGVDAAVFGRGDAEFAAVLAAVTAAGIAQHEQLEEARRLAFTDPLTGLANRRAVDSRLADGLARHRETGAVLSLVVCDINGLKRVNDEYGHEEGDRLLERFGRLLSLCGASLGGTPPGGPPGTPAEVPAGAGPSGGAAREAADSGGAAGAGGPAGPGGTLAARLGGDEFCLVVLGPSADDVVRAAAEVCRRAEELGAGEGVACGVASTGDPVGPVRSARRLFRLADAAQYQAKAARARGPVVAGRAGAAGTGGDPVVQLADTPARPGQERRRIRGRRTCSGRTDGGERGRRGGRYGRSGYGDRDGNHGGNDHGGTASHRARHHRGREAHWGGHEAHHRRRDHGPPDT